MARPLPVALVQAATLPASSPLSVFTDDVQKVLCDFPLTRLVVYPELHLTGLAGDAAQRDAVMRDHHLAAFLPHSARRPGAAPDHADEDHHPLRPGGGGRMQ